MYIFKFKAGIVSSPSDTAVSRELGLLRESSMFAPKTARKE